MAGQGKLFKLLSSFGNYRNLLTTRLTIAPTFVQNAGLKMETKDKLKTLKIPEHPKRPLTPYFRFLAEHRAVVQKKHPDWKLIDITKQCALDWKDVSETIKDKYQQEYNQEIEVYEQKTQKYTASLTPEQAQALAEAKLEKRNSKKKRILKKRYREAERPKRPIGSFLFYIKEKWALPENKSKKLADLLSTYKVEWKDMSDAEKEKYTNMHNKDKERYNKQMSEWESKMVDEGNFDIVRKESQFAAAGKPSHIDGPKQKVR